MIARAPLSIALTMGDPAGCGPQITGKAWRTLKDQAEFTFFAIGPADVFAPHSPVVRIETVTQAARVFKTALPVLDIDTDCPSISPGRPDEDAAPSIIASIKSAVDLALSQSISAIVTNPINKALLYNTGFKYPGHTEFLADLCTPSANPSKRPVMMLVGGGLRVALATIHMPLADVPEALSKELLVDITKITNSALIRDFGLKSPRIAFTGLNPHAGEDGRLGAEEIESINPAARHLRDLGINVSDARSADTVFAESLDGAYDAVIAMTHDQGLIPVKTLDFWGGVNVTLGLPIVRTSPDHGTAYDAAKSGNCRADSLIAAIKLAAANAANRCDD